MSSVPAGLKYSKEHEWVKMDGNIANSTADFVTGPPRRAKLRLIPYLSARPARSACSLNASTPAHTGRQ